MAKRKPEPEPDDPLVKLLHGYVEDRPIWTGAIAEVLVHPAGTIMRRSEAVALGVDDYILVPPSVESDEFISGPARPVIDESLGHGYEPVVDAQLFNSEPRP